MTGRAIEGEAWLSQAVDDVLTTSIGWRAMRRDYGSLLPELIDQPFNPATRVKLYAAVALALLRARLPYRLRRVQLSPGDRAGAFVIDLYGERTDVPAASALTRLTVSIARTAAPAAAGFA